MRRELGKLRRRFLESDKFSYEFGVKIPSDLIRFMFSFGGREFSNVGNVKNKRKYKRLRWK